jgi:hypothetical protein
MPGFDGAGPAGRGPMTGGGRGWCNPYRAPYTGYRPYAPPYAVPRGATYAYGPGRPRWGLGRGFGGRGWGLGWGRGRGLERGRGRGRGWW